MLQEPHTFLQDGSSCYSHHQIIKHDSHRHTSHQQQYELLYPHGSHISDRHHAQGCQSKRQDVFQEHPYLVAYQLVGEILPDKQPYQVEYHISLHHIVDTPMPYQEHGHYLYDAQGECHQEISSRLSLAHQQIRQQGAYREHCAADAKDSQQVSTRQPFLGNRNDDKLPLTPYQSLTSKGRR